MGMLLRWWIRRCLRPTLQLTAAVLARRKSYTLPASKRRLIEKPSFGFSSAKAHWFGPSESLNVIACTSMSCTPTGTPA